MPETFYWHDYETFGAHPARDRPAQFAGVRTDAELNIIGEPLVIFCRPANDYLPHPQACLVTGITPQQALAQGVPECEFIAAIHQQLAAPGTCGAGYNSLRFDDEGHLIGITLVRPKELLEKEDGLQVTLPAPRHVPAEELTPALHG